MCFSLKRVVAAQVVRVVVPDVAVWMTVLVTFILVKTALSHDIIGDQQTSVVEQSHQVRLSILEKKLNIALY